MIYPAVAGSRFARPSIIGKLGLLLLVALCTLVFASSADSQKVKSLAASQTSIRSELSSIASHDVSVRFYPVNELSFDSFLVTLLKNAPKNKLGQRVIALTRWKFSWSYPEQKPHFSGKEVAVESSIEIVLPELRSGSKAIHSVWPCLSGYLVQHEKEHAESFANLLSEFKAVLEETPRLNLEQLRALGRRYQQRMQEFDRSFDKRFQGWFEAYVEGFRTGRQMCSQEVL